MSFGGGKYNVVVIVAVWQWRWFMGVGFEKIIISFLFNELLFYFFSFLYLFYEFLVLIKIVQ